MEIDNVVWADRELDNFSDKITIDLSLGGWQPASGATETCPKDGAGQTKTGEIGEPLGIRVP